jgi:hypothetical protein
MSFETTNFEDVLREACGEAGQDADNIGQPEFMAWRRFAARRLDIVWRFHFWPFLQRCEQRYYRAAYDAAQTYTAQAEVYWPLTGQYFTALQAVPVSQNPTDSSGTVNLAYWALTAQYSQQSDLAEATAFSATTTYTQGARVNYIGNIYQLFTVSSTGNLPTDTANWGIINPFNAYVAYEQTGQTPFSIVEGAWSANPAVSTRGNELNWWLSADGVQIATPISYAWVQFRLRSPKLNGNLFRADIAYTASAQMYYSSAATPGNFYTAATATSAGDTPDSAPDKWTAVALPRAFHRYLVLGMAADWEKFEGEDEPNGLQTAMALDALAQAELDDTKSLFVGQMGQRIKTQIRTR